MQRKTDKCVRPLQQQAAQFTHHMKCCDWETFAQRRTTAGLWALCKAYCGERAWKAIGDRLRGTYGLSGVDHVRKNRDGSKERTSGNIPL